MSSPARVGSPAPHHARPYILPQQIYFRISDFVLESGETLLGARVAFTFRGLLNAERDNAIVVCHGFADNADVEDWWSPMLNRINPALDPRKFCIICCNSLGSPFGSSSPLTYRSDSRGKIGDERYALQFPRTTFRDDVHIHKRVIDILGVRSVFCVIGQGMGNITAVEWARLGPDYVRAMVLLETKPSYGGSVPLVPLGNDCFPEAGSRCWHSSDRKRTTRTSTQCCSSGALDFSYDQPDRPGVFDKECYMYMLDKINSYTSDLYREEEGLTGVLAQIKQPTLVIGVDEPCHDTATERELVYGNLSGIFMLLEKEERIAGSLLEAEELDARLHSFFRSISSGRYP